MRGWPTTRPAPPVVGEGLLYVLVALVMMWPVSLHPTASFVGHLDASYYMWLSWRLGRLIATGDILSLSIPDVVFPYGSELLLVDGLLPSFVGGLWNLVAGPFLAHNLTLLTATLLNLWAGRRLGRLFSEQRVVWIITALSFATAPAIVLRMFVHLPLYFAFPVPLLLERAVRTTRDGRQLRPLEIALLLALSYLCSVYFLVFGGLAFALFVLTATMDRAVLLQRLARLLVVVGITFVLLLPFSIPRLVRDRAESAAGGRPVLIDDSFRSSADVLSIAAQPAPSTFDVPGSARLRRTFRPIAVHESTIFPGFLALAGGLGATLLLPIAIKRQILLTALSLWLLALGTSLKVDGEFLFTWSDGRPAAYLPYTLFFHVPGLGSLRAANRVSFTLAAVLTLGLGASLGWLFDRSASGRARTAATVGAGAILVTNLLVPVPQTRFEVTSATRRALTEIARRAGASESAVVVPADCGFETLPDVKLQIIHRAPLVGCQASSSSLPLYSDLELYVASRGLAALRCDPERLYSRPVPFDRREALDAKDLRVLSRKLGVRYLIVDKMLLAASECARLRAGIAVLERYEVLGEDSRWLIVDTATRAG